MHTDGEAFVKHFQLIYYVLSVPFHLRKCNCVPENNIPEMHSDGPHRDRWTKNEQEDQTTLRIQGFEFASRNYVLFSVSRYVNRMNECDFTKITRRKVLVKILFNAISARVLEFHAATIFYVC